MWFKVIRFALRVILLLVAVVAGGYFFNFICDFHTLSVDQLSDTFAIISSKPVMSIMVGVGIVLFVLSLLGFIMLLQYQIWRYPLSIFAGYIIGILLYYQFYLLHPFQESVLHLNDNIWYYPLLISTVLLLRAIIGFKLPRRKKAKESIAST